MFWVYGLNIYYLLLTSLIFGAIQLLLLLNYVKLLKIKIQFENNFLKNSLRIIKISFPLGLAVLLNFLYQKIDVILISEIIGVKGVAQYNVAYSFYQLSALIFGVIWIPILNLFTKERKNTIENIKNLVFSSLIIFTISLLILLGFYFLGETIIKYILGIKYKEAASLLPVLSFTVVGFGISGVMGMFLSAYKEFKALAIFALIALIINVVFNIYFLTKIGIIAAAYSTIITEYIILVLEIFYIIYLYKKTNMINEK
jgi:O-antigen/teichoic acid export membrane protein